MGKGKAPHGLEQNYSDATLPYVERSPANALVPLRDVGLTVLGDLFKSRLSYVAGVENGAVDGTTADTDANGGKDLVGRVIARFGPAGFSLSGTRGQESGALPSFKTTSQQTYFAYASGITAAGTRSRVSPGLFVFRKSVGAYAEYFSTTQAVAESGSVTSVTNSGWNATGVFVLTGEAATERGATPKRPFDPAEGHWGALQLAIRVSELRVDPHVFTLGYAASGASRIARAVGVGVVWYNNANIKHMLTFERTVFDRDAKGPRKPENALVFRVQFSLSPRL